MVKSHNLMNDINNITKNSQNKDIQVTTSLPIANAAKRPVDKRQMTIFISGLVLATLLGIIIGIFAASKNKQTGGDTANKKTKSDQSWLNAQIPDLSPDLSNDTGSASLTDSEINSNDLQNSSGNADNPDLTAGDENSSPATNTDDSNVHRGEVKKGVPVIKNLTSIGLSVADAQLIINALDGVFNFRRARPGQTFEVRFSNINDKVESFTYQVSKTEIYKVIRSGGKFSGRKLNIVTDKKIKIFAGTITTSLFGTMKDLGARPALAAKVADILSKQVNFLKEQRPGDTFKVAVQEESLDGEFQRYGPVLAMEYNGVKAGKRSLFYLDDGKNTPAYYDNRMISLPHSALTIPLYYSHMSSPFGWRIHPILKTKKLHNGTDFAAPAGTPVWACAEGTIIFAAKKGANGNLIGIDHGNGLNSYYAHLIRFARGIKKGVRVRRKQLIGYVGSTGRSTGPHLHWGIKLNGKFVDPLKYKIIPGRKVPAKNRGSLKKLIRKWSSLLDKTPITPPKGEISKVQEGGEPLSD